MSTGGAEPNAGQPRGTALADATTPARDSAQPPPAAAPPTWSLHVGGGILTPAPGASPTPVLSLEPQVFLGAWRLSLLGAFSFGGSVAVVDQSVTRGTLTARDVLAVPSLGLCTTARVELCGTVLAGLRLVLGESSGSLLFQSQFRVLGAFVTGAGVELTLNLGPVRLTLAAALLVNPVPASLTLTGLPTTLTTPVLEGVVRGTVGFGTPRWHKE